MTVADYRSKSMTVGVASGLSEPSPQVEKDYFKVTDELGQENAHHTMSEKMVEVLEQYRANTLEKARLKGHTSQAPPTTSIPTSVDTSTLCPSSPTSVSGASKLQSPSGSTLGHSPSSNLHVLSKAAFSPSPPTMERSFSSRVPLELSSWSSMSSIATTEGEMVGESVRWWGRV